MRYYIFSTGGDWDSTTLFLNGENFPATRLYIGLQTPADGNGNPTSGGIRQGGQIEAFVMPDQDDAREQAIFPGRIDLEFPNHKVTMINDSPMFSAELTSILMDGKEISDKIIEMSVNIDSVANEASAYLMIYKPHVFAADEVATYNLL